MDQLGMLVNNAPDFAGEFVNDTADARTNLYNAIGAVGKAGNWSERVFADFDSMVVATEDSRKVMAKFANFCKFLAGSFSAVSKRNFARKYAFDSIFQALQDLYPFAPLQSQIFSKKSV